MAIDIHDSNFDSNIDKVLELTAAGASLTSITFAITKTQPDEESRYLDIVLRKAEALLVAETIRIYFEHAIL